MGWWGSPRHRWSSDTSVRIDELLDDDQVVGHPGQAFRAVVEVGEAVRQFGPDPGGRLDGGGELGWVGRG